MGDPLHDNEPDLSDAVVRSLLSEQTPELAGCDLASLQTSGTSNAAWRVRRDSATDLIVRLPRTSGAARSVEPERRVLEWIAASELATRYCVPALHHVGQPGGGFPYAWLMLEWIEGTDAWESRDQLTGVNFGLELAELVRSIRLVQMPNAPTRQPGERGGPLAPVLHNLEQWLRDPKWSAGRLIDVAAVRRSAAESAEVSGDAGAQVFSHGDLIPGNLLVEQGRLSGVIDWANAGIADEAQDVGLAWSILDGHARQAFRDHLGVDDTTWLRARGFELEQAVGAVLYYKPRGHLLAEVLERTLDRILT